MSNDSIFRFTSAARQAPGGGPHTLASRAAIVLVTCAVLTCVASSVKGQDDFGRFMVGVSAGNAFFLRDVDLNTEQIAPSLTGYTQHSGFDGAPALGLQLGFRPTSRFELDAFAHFVPTTFRIQVDRLSYNIGENLYWMGGQLLYYLDARGGVDPFLLLGGGISADDLISGGHDNTDPLFQGGGGVRFAIGNRLGVRLTARDYVIPWNQLADRDLGIGTSWQHVLGFMIGTTYGL